MDKYYLIEQFAKTKDFSDKRETRKTFFYRIEPLRNDNRVENIERKNTRNNAIKKFIDI